MKIERTLENFCKWVERFNPDDVVGFAWSIEDCPLARWARLIEQPRWTSWGAENILWPNIIARLVDCFPPETPIKSGTVVEFISAMRLFVHLPAEQRR